MRQRRASDRDIAGFHLVRVYIGAGTILSRERTNPSALLPVRVQEVPGKSQ